jgi:transcriptional regulator of aromatic amino acid metabolism
MRRWILAAVVALISLSNTGCVLNIWSSDPNERTQQLLNVSEDLRQIRAEWNRFWMIDQPSHLTPVRIHGGLGPGAF